MPLVLTYPCCPCGSHLGCRYAWSRYKPRYVCFGCRKAFKRRFREEVDPSGVPTEARCPDCGLPAIELGLGFRPPPRRQVREWAALEAVARRGVRFLCCDGPSQPRDLHEHRRLVARSEQDRPSRSGQTAR